MPEDEMTDRAHGALSGLRVLELGEMVAAPYCAKLLGDLGAEVIKVESPAGDPARARGPFPDDASHPERSALFLYLNTSKRSIALDLSREEGRDRFRRLAARVDVLIEDRPPGALAEMGLGYESLAALNPGLVVTSITPFGQTGPNRTHESRHLNLYHSAGHASPFAALDADSRRAPPRAGGYLGEYDAGLTAGVGTLAALYGREKTGHGQHIDVSKQEAMMCLERVTIGRYANATDPFAGRRGPGGMIRAKDGWVMITTLEMHQWEGLLRAMGNPDWSRADWCRDPVARMEHADEVAEHTAAWAAELSREEIYHRCQSEGTPAAPVRNVAEVLAWEQPRARGFFRSLDHPEAGSLTLPAAPWRSSRTQWVGTRAPLLGEHEQAILAELEDESVTPPPAAVDANAAGEEEGPLAGVRIADFTWAWAGPQGSLLLGMLGAEVVKLESRARLDHSRVHSLAAGSIQGGIDESPLFNDLNLGKQSVTLNLKKEQARELVRDLARKSDVVLQNMRPGVLDRMGLGYDDLRARNPELIMLSSSAVGASGPERTYAGYAPTFACLSGIASISGHPDEPPIALSGSVDLRVGTMSAFAVIAALLHRCRTGEGQDIDLSSTEVMTSMMGEALVGYELTGRVPERIGNADDRMAPHGAYRCAGEAEWATIAVDGEAEWRALRSVLGDPALAHADFEDAERRLANRDRLDALVERWTRARPAAEVVATLQAAGIPAAHLHTGASLARDPHVLAREIFQPIEHPRLGTLQVVGPPWRMHGALVKGPAPLLGQHNREVLRGVLGLTDAEIDDLVAAEVVY